MCEARIDALYDETCGGYAVAFFNLECNRDPLYDSQCDGYHEELAYQDSLNNMDDTNNDDMYGYDDGFDEYGQQEDNGYGFDDNGMAYTQDDLWYDEEFDEYLDPNDPWSNVLQQYECANCNNYIPAHLAERWDDVSFEKVMEEWVNIYR